MTRAARRDVAAARLRARRMTPKTSCMSVEVSGDRHGHAPAGGTMTGSTVNAAHRQMLRMVELHPETYQSIGERFHRA